MGEDSTSKEDIFDNTSNLEIVSSKELPSERKDKKDLVVIKAKSKKGDPER
jgi:hypothetical protein